MATFVGGTGVKPGERLASALQAGQVSQLEDGSGKYLCRVCDKTLANKQTVTKHLSCERHQKLLSSYQSMPTQPGAAQKKNVTFASPQVSSYKTVPTQPSTQQRHCSAAPPQVCGAGAKVKPGDKLARALQDGQVSELKDCSGKYRCHVCDAVLSSKQTITKHILDNKKHQANVTTFIPVPTQTNQRHENVVVTPQVGGTGVKPSDKLTSALQAGQVSQLEDGTGKYLCRVCDKTLANKQTIKSHLTINRHLKQISSCNEETPLTKPAVLQDDDGRSMVIEMDNEDAGSCYWCLLCCEHFVGTVEHHLSSLKHQRQAKSNNSYVRPKPKQVNVDYGNTYRTKSHPTGHVYVINNKFKNAKKNKDKRSGAEHDTRNIKSTFVKLGYKVIIYEDLTQGQTDEVLDSIRDDESLERIDSIIIFILSHGLGTNKPFVYLSNDGKQMSLTDLRQRFSDVSCPQMRNKPKIVFSNFCRGPVEVNLEHDGDNIVPRNIVTIHAASENCKAIRSADVGTIFVKSLCEVLQDIQEEMELKEVYHKLQLRMSSYGGTTPVWEENVFCKKFFFKRTY